MKTIQLGKTNVKMPAVVVGCMRINALSSAELRNFLEGAIDHGATLFDHADIYGGGKCETMFADAIKMSSMRQKIMLQSKCAIRPNMYDFSKNHIITSTENILQRLKTDYLDILMLHRPDALGEPEEVAAAFDALESSGKVKYFGVSNHNALQIQLLQKFVKQPICVNQFQLSLTNSIPITEGLHVNLYDDGAVMRGGNVLDFCRLNDITVQTWSPLQFGFFAGVFLDNPKFPALNKKIDELAAQYGVSNTTIAIAWILRHPANMQVVTGTTNPSRLADCIKASDVTLTREEWYALYLAAGNTLP
ncbi:MAG: aldo/keto reductase family oxidoreductase [Treponemataceae bacterium]|nr:MAG: aldo/keto reductase family oxidoreductase [Treponemataceae bacterium]